jgi:hypothetical protein
MGQEQLVSSSEEDVAQLIEGARLVKLLSIDHAPGAASASRGADRDVGQRDRPDDLAVQIERVVPASGNLPGSH